MQPITQLVWEHLCLEHSVRILTHFLGLTLSSRFHLVVNTAKVWLLIGCILFCVITTKETILIPRELSNLILQDNNKPAPHIRHNVITFEHNHVELRMEVDLQQHRDGEQGACLTCRPCISTQLAEGEGHTAWQSTACPLLPTRRSSGHAWCH